MARLLWLLFGAVAGGVLVGQWLRDDDAERARALQSRVDELQEQMEARVGELEDAIARRDAQIAYLRDRVRVARIEVLAQAEDPEAAGGKRTRFRFVEVSPDGEPLGPGRTFEIEGDVLYVDAQVIKFDDAFVEEQDLLRGSTLLLFRRLFGEHQAPSQGFPLDPVGERPLAYSAEEGPPPFHRRLWERFWEYANEPEVAAQSGVRAMHGEAPYMRLDPGREYRIELRTSGGLTIRAESGP